MTIDARTYMPLYIGSYRKNTNRLSTEEHGAYMLLLMDYWVAGAPPDDDTILARITGLTVDRWREVRPRLAGYFRIANGVWRQARIEIELERAQTMVRRAAKGGRASADAKKRRKEVQSLEKNGTYATAETPNNSNVYQLALNSSTPSRTHTLPSPSEKKEDSGAKAPAREGAQDEALDLKEIVFGKVLRWVHRRLPGKTENGLRAWLGKLIRDYGEAWVLEAARRAQREAAIEPVAFIEGCLRKMKQQGGPGHRPERASSSAIAGTDRKEES